MKNLFVALSFLFALNPVFAATYDPFAGPPGSNLATQTDSNGNVWNLFASAQTGAEPVLSAGSLSYPNLSSSSGNSVTITAGNGRGDRAAFAATAVTSGTVYYSFILQVTDISSVSTAAANNYIAGFSDSTATQTATLARCGARLVSKKNGTGFQLGVSRTSATSDMVYDPTVRNVNDVLFVVVCYERTAVSGGTTNVSLWVNPASSSFGNATPPTPTVAVSPGVTGGVSTGDVNANGCRTFLLACNSGSPTAIIDEVRVSTTWTYVTGDDPAILQQPNSLTLAPGTDGSFNVVARGTDPVTYQWLKDTSNLTDGGNISGSTTASLTVGSVSPSDAGSYSVVITSANGSTTSSIATLTLSDPAISGQPQSRTNDFGTTATFSVTTLGTAPFGYQWQKNGSDLGDGGNVSGSQSNVLTLTGVSSSDVASYTVVVTNPVGTATSSVALLTVRDPIILTQPVSITNNAGSIVTFNVTSAGTAPLLFQWKKNGTNLSDGGTISGALTDTLTISGISPSDEGLYRVAVSGPGGTNTSSDASLTVINPVTILSHPSSRKVVTGSRVVFAVGVFGTSPSYQWQKNAANIPGATSYFYAVNNAQAADEGSYTVVVSNVIGTVTSSVATLSTAASVELYETNLVIARIGDGAQTLATTGNSIYIDQFTPAGNYVNTVTIPETGVTGMIQSGPDQNGSSVTGCLLTRSADKKNIVLGGYRVDLGNTTALQSTTSTSVPRAVALINSAGQYTLALADTNAFSTSHFRGAAYDGTNNFWGVGSAGGTYYFGTNGPGSSVQTTFGNLRSVDIFNGNLYSLNSSGAGALVKFDGLPTTNIGTATNLLPGFNSISTTDFSVDPTSTIIYLTVGGNVQKWQFDGTSWTNAYSLSLGTGTLRYLTVDYSGSAPVLYVTTAETTYNRLLTITDTGTNAVPTTLATAGINQMFKGIRFGPTGASVAPPTIFASFSSGNLTLTWSGSFTLQSSTDAAGPYTDVIGGASPYSTTTTEAQRFYRLRN